MKNNRKNELNDEEINEVNGGGCFSSLKGYKSGSDPLFKIGDRVGVKETNFFTDSTFKFGRIIEVLSKSLNINSEYRYKVKYDDGSTESDVFESQMLYESLNDGSYQKNCDPNS